MKHGISELEWNDYLDGRASGEARDRIEAHFIGCLECWEFYEQMSCATQELLEAGEEARQGLALEDRQLHAMLRGVFARLRAGQSRSAVHAQVRRRLDVLERVLALFCGTQAAGRALQAAAKDSPACSLERVTPENWEPFLERLTAIAAAMCGDTFAGLIQEQGRF
jgi:hypothetical protein